jgi:hypothetical protein
MARLQTQKAETHMRKRTKIALWAAGLVVVPLAINAISRSTSSTPQEVTVRLAAPVACSTSLGDLGLIDSVQANDDRAALEGLVQRKKALVIPKGTLVHVYTHDAEAATLFIRSGSLAGEDCWIRPDWVQPAK